MISICGAHPVLFSFCAVVQKANAGFDSPGLVELLARGGQGFTFLVRGET